jgi:hypothetical protein
MALLKMWQRRVCRHSMTRHYCGQQASIVLVHKGPPIRLTPTLTTLPRSANEYELWTGNKRASILQDTITISACKDRRNLRYTVPRLRFERHAARCKSSSLLLNKCACFLVSQKSYFIGVYYSYDVFWNVTSELAWRSNKYPRPTKQTLRTSYAVHLVRFVLWKCKHLGMW